MSKGDVVYVKGMKYSDSDGDDAEDIWDDRKLNEAYDKAVKIAQTEVARRVAMATNTHTEDTEGDRSKNKKEKSKTPSKCQWKAGMPCRAVYDHDGLEYEAIVSRIINDKECVVKFLGYDNYEIVPINSLKPSCGKEEQARQIERSLAENADDGFASQSPIGEKMDIGSDRVPSPGGTEQSFQRKKKSPKKKSKKTTNGFDLPDVPFMPHSMSMLRNLGNVELPLPPPPPMSLPVSDRTDSEEQAMSSMLLSWYMSGYYTGLYQGMKRARESRRSS